MDVRQSRLIEDMAGIFRGEILCDPLSRSLYASDGSLHQMMPLGVACPRDREDVQVLTRYAAEMRLPLVARGSGSSVAGEALGSGLIVDFSRHMHVVEEIGAQTVRVQPGVIHERLNRLLRESGRYYPPDPSNTATTTIGSMLALDAAGSHSIRVGSARDHVVSLEVMMAHGVHFEMGDELVDHSMKASADSNLDGNGNEKRILVSRLATLLKVNSKLIQEKQPERQIRNRAGYMLRGVLSNSHLSLPRLLVGSEGTLGLFTSATLRTSALPANRCVLLLVYGSVESAIESVRMIALHQISACDLVDRRLLTLARDLDPRFASLIPATAEAALIVELTGFSQSEVTNRAADLTKQLNESSDPGRTLFQATTYDEIEFLWSLPNRVIPLLNRARGETSPLPIVEDIAVPPDALSDFVVKARRIWQKYEITASLYAHAAVGQLHIRPFLKAPIDARRVEDLARDLYHAAISVGGSISGEHGLGLSRTAFLRSQYGELYRVFQAVKGIFDPQNLLNPGKILSDDPHVTVNHLRPEVGASSSLVELQLKWQPNEFAATATSCHGCGACRTQEPDTRMCPFFRAEVSEQHSPRAKANAVRVIVDGLLPSHEMASVEMHELSKSCFNCKQCQLECPNEINIPHLMLEAKSQYVTANGPKMSEWFLSRVHSFGDILCRLSWLINPLLNTGAFRWTLERFCGVSQRRKLPPFSRRTFLNSAPRQWTSPPVSLRDPVPVIYFVDHYANFHDPELAFAFARIVEHHGRTIHVPPSQSRSGMAFISTGDLDAARQLATKNVRTLAEFAREGCPIVCTEPAAAICLKFEYPRIIDHPDVQIVAEQVVDAGEFLSQLRVSDQLKMNFSPVPVIATYHAPCHLRALGRRMPLLELCNMIPRFQASSDDLGCSGFAGTFGLTREHFDESLAIGRNLIEQMRSDSIELGITECSSCKMQMEQQSTTPTLHPLKVLALAYGLMPEIRRRFRPNLRKRLTS